MTAHWTEELGDDELLARLEQHGVEPDDPKVLVEHRDSPYASARIRRVLGD